MLTLDDEVAGPRVARAERRALVIRGVPRPCVPVPEGRQQVELRGLGPAVHHSDADQDVVGRRLRILDQHVEVAVFVEDARVHQLELGRPPVATPVFRHQPRVRELRLRILVEELHV